MADLDLTQLAADMLPVREKRLRLSRERAKLNPIEEKSMAEEGLRDVEATYFAG